MEKDKKYTYDFLKKEALKYESKIDFIKQDKVLYQYVYRKGILNEICSHMRCKIIWSNDLLKKEAIKYESKIEFNKKNKSAYAAAKRKGILNEICSHMRSNIRWSYDLLKKEALKYESRTEFSNNNSAYSAAQRYGILNEICSHMEPMGSKYNRYIYTIEFENKKIYIGLTGNLNRRKESHFKNSHNKFIKDLLLNGYEGIFNSDRKLYKYDQVGKIENDLIDYYKINGYDVLNIKKGGNLGGNDKKWTFQLLNNESLKYNRRVDFQKNSNNAYQVAYKRGILNDICSHMTKKKTK